MAVDTTKSDAWLDERTEANFVEWLNKRGQEDSKLMRSFFYDCYQDAFLWGTIEMLRMVNDNSIYNLEAKTNE